MQDELTEERQFSIGGFFLKCLGLFLLVFPIMATLKFDLLMQASDYQMNFHIAGRLIAEGKALLLYPSAKDVSFITTEFNKTAHALLPALPSRMVAVYMYSPLTAMIFAPFSMLGRTYSMAAWQAVSIVSFLACVISVARICAMRWTEALKHAFFYMPVFLTLLIGQLGIVLGVLPLSVGLHLLFRKRPLTAGLVWSLLLLKPQFLPVALLLSGALLLDRKPRCLIGLICGALAISALTILSVGQPVLLSWFSTLKMSDTILSDPRYGYPAYLVSSLPAAVLQFVPVAQRSIFKIVLYALALGISLHALWVSLQLIRKKGEDEKTTNLAFVVLIGIAVLPMVLPHFLVYDLCVLSIFGILANSNWWSEHERRILVSNHWLYLITLNIYTCVFLFSPDKRFAQPLVIVVVMGLLYYRLLRLAQGRLISEPTGPAVSSADSGDGTESRPASPNSPGATGESPSAGSE